MKKDSTTDASRTPRPADVDYFEDHRALKVIIERVRGTHDLHLMIPLLDELHRLLDEHFAREEAANGLYKTVSAAAPHRLERVQELLDQHGDFLKTVRSIRSKTKYLIEVTMAEVFDDVETLCKGLEIHEASENEILSDALYRDLGESG